MRRRQGFTLVELLVAMALIIFIMAILSQAFGAAMTTFRNLKALGDMSEKLRATTQLLQRDLAADHFEGKKRLSDLNFWVNGPPQQGFFQIVQGSAGTSEGLDTDGIHSVYSTNHSLSFAVKLRGNQMGEFLSTSGQGGGSTPLVNTVPPGLTLSTLPNFGPIESRYQLTSGGAYNYQWGAVAWFLVASGDSTITDPTTGQAGVPLYTLYRRQALLVPDNNSIPPQPAGNIASFAEMSCWTNGASLYFNSPIDITVPTRRFWGGAPAYTPMSGALTGSDIQLTDVVSFDVRMLFSQPVGVTNGIDPFVTLVSNPPLFLSYANQVLQIQQNFPGQAYNPAFNVITGPIVFDTWSSLNDGSANYSQWNVSSSWDIITNQEIPNPMAIPLWNGTSGPIIQAIQITIRIWDYKTNQTRQVTLVQAM